MSDVPRLHPLRVPAGWRVDWNSLYPVEPVPANAAHFIGSTLFSAVHEGARCWIDVEWRPEGDVTGHYNLRVEYQPWPRTPAGRRRRGAPLRFDGASQGVHRFGTRDLAALVAELERWLEECPRRVFEGS